LDLGSDEALNYVARDAEIGAAGVSGGNMVKVRQAGLWLAIACIVLAMQGCWEEEGTQLTLLGDGGCRTADGSEGAYSVVRERSEDSCKTRCFGANAPCTAVEFNANNGQCEVHTQPITQYEKVAGVTCLVAR